MALGVFDYSWKNAPLVVHLTPSAQGWVVTVNGEQQATIHGFDALDFAVGPGQSTLTGGAEADHFAVSGGTALMSTGGGDDVVEIHYEHNSLNYTKGVYTIDDGASIDTLTFNGTVQGEGSLVLDARAEHGILKVGPANASSFTGIEIFSVIGTSRDDTVFSGAGNDKIDGEFGHDSVCGGAGDDRLSGWDGNDLLFGGSGNDRIEGGRGADTMAGSTGADVFCFGTALDSGIRVGKIDNINYFTVVKTHAGHIDQIDVSDVDAKPLTLIDDAFTFIGTAAFTAAVQVRVARLGTASFVELNTGGTLDADSKICLTQFTATNLGAEDFILERAIVAKGETKTVRC